MEHPGGEALRVAREHLGLKLSQVSRTLRLPVKYLEALETGNWLDLPGDSYTRYFIKAYAGYLGLPSEPLLEQYVSISAPAAKSRLVLSPPRPTRLFNQPLTHPLRRWLLIIVIVGVAVYVGILAWRTYTPPTVTVVSPVTDYSTSTPTVVVSGLTQTGVQIFINNQLVAVSDQGKFSQTLALTPGLNAITIVAQKVYSQPIRIERRVLYTPVAAPATPSPVVPKLVP